MKDPAMLDDSKPAPPWVPMFLAALATNGGIVPDACQSSGATEADVSQHREADAGFAAAFRMVIEEMNKRASKALRADKRRRDERARNEKVSAADFAHYVGNGHAKEAVFKADLDTLLLLCVHIVGMAGYHEVEGMPVGEWFRRARRATLQRQMQELAASDPDLAAHIERHFNAIREQTSPHSILRPLEG